MIGIKYELHGIYQNKHGNSVIQVNLLIHDFFSELQ